MADANIIVIGGNADDQDHDIPDNTNPAWRVHQGGTDYIAIATTNSAECVKLVSSGTGRVSIGTHDPYTNIDAAADNLVVGDGSGDEGITIVSGPNVGDHGAIYFGDASSGTQGQIRYEQNNEVMSFYTNTAERMRIDLQGDVGIGTTNPTSVLDAQSSGSALANFQCTDGGATDSVVVFRADGTGDPKTQYSLNGTVQFSMGVDNSDSDKFKIAGDTNLQTNTRLTIDSAGLIGIGTASPIAQLHLQKDAGDAVALFQCNDASFGVDEIYGKIDFGNRSYDDRICSIVAAQEAACNSGATANGYLAFYTEESGAALTEKMRISSAGKVGIGTDAPATKFHVKRTDGSAHDAVILGQYESTVGNTQLRLTGKATETAGAYGFGRWGAGAVFINSDNTAGNYTGFQNINADGYGNCGINFVNKAHGTTTTEGEIHFYTRASGGGYVEAGRWDEEGNLGIGVTNPAHEIDVSGTAGLTTGTAWTNTSDSRVKQNVETIENALEKIEALRPVSFEYTQDYIDCTRGLVPGQRYNSFIAQEYAEVFPNAVSVGPDLIKESPEEEPTVLLTDLKQFTPHDLNMYLVRAVQELSAQIKELKEGK